MDITPLDEVMTEVVLQEVETYIARRQNTVAQYIATRPIMDLCLTEVRRPGARVLKRLWEQDGIDIEGIKEAAWVEETDTERV